MTKQCPECKSLLYGNSARCNACGCRIDQAGEAYKTWESRMLPFLIIVVVIAVAVALVAYLRGWFKF